MHAHKHFHASEEKIWKRTNNVCEIWYIVPDSFPNIYMYSKKLCINFFYLSYSCLWLQYAFQLQTFQYIFKYWWLNKLLVVISLAIGFIVIFIFLTLKALIVSWLLWITSLALITFIIIEICWWIHAYVFVH